MSGLEVLRLLVGGGFLLYAAILDLRTRRVPNRVWIALGLLASLLFAFDWAAEGRFGWVTVLVAVGLAALAYLLWFFHLLAGGADAKALMALAVLVPRPIAWTLSDASLPAWPSPLPGAIVALANSVFLFALAPLGLVVVNLVRRDVRFPSMLLGYTLPLEAARRSFVWVVDHVDEAGNRRQVLFPSRTSEEDYLANLERLEREGAERVWVTPKIPFMVPLLLGFVAAFIVGDILFRIVSLAVQAMR